MLLETAVAAGKHLAKELEVRTHGKSKVVYGMASWACGG
jgi:hypothetical protein